MSGIRGRILLFSLIPFTFWGCHSLPAVNEAPDSYKIVDTSDTFFARQYRDAFDTFDAPSAVHPLVSGTDAFYARVALARLAEKSLDLQYYIWNRDSTGTLLAAQLLDAADRGVRVRMLLDDLGSPVGDDRLLKLNQHPNIEVRLFNPASNRSRGAVSLALEFGRINHRMHNKSMTADNTLTIVGGRNIGDEYFSAHREYGYSDLDLLAAGEIVDQVSDSFDLYWNYRTTWPVDSLTNKTFSEQEIEAFYERARPLAKTALDESYLERLQNTSLARNTGQLEWYWGDAQLVYDHPAKAEGDDSRRLVTKLSGVVEGLREELIVVSPYFVPGDQGVDFFSRLVDRGVKVMIITNSLAATDVSVVHAGYSRYRKELLEAGVQLYELRAHPAAVSPPDHELPEKPVYLVGSSARASLHAKAFFFDRETTFIGSLNLDPRSIEINTEVGIVIENIELTRTASERLRESVTRSAYELSLDDDGDLVWMSFEGNEVQRYHSEPEVSLWRRFSTWLLGLFPIESQL